MVVLETRISQISNWKSTYERH